MLFGHNKPNFHREGDCGIGDVTTVQTVEQEPAPTNSGEALAKLIATIEKLKDELPSPEAHDVQGQTDRKQLFDDIDKALVYTKIFMQ